MNKYKVKAKDDLAIEGHEHHYWKKGLDYEVEEKGDYFSLATELGHVNYYLSSKDSVFLNFEIVK